MVINSKIRKVQLSIDQNLSSELYGIVTTEPDYKLSLLLNKKLKLSLKNTDPVIIQGDSSEMIFSKFSDTTSSHGMVYELISNHSGKNVLFRKLKNLDYFFVVSDPEEDSCNRTVLPMLREITVVSAVFSLDPQTIKDKNIQYLIH